MLENPNKNEGIESRHDTREPKIKNEGIDYRHNSRDPETKRRDRVRERCRRTRNITKGSNPGEMPENLKQNEGSNRGAMSENLKQKEKIESGRNTGEPETKGRDQIWAQCQRTQIKIKGSNLGEISENPR